MTSPQRDAARIRRWRYAAVVLVVSASLVGLGVFSVVGASHSGPRRDTNGQLTEQGGPKPHIIPPPNSGHAPTGPGDRGGWQQLLTLGLIVSGIVGLGLLAWRGSRKAGAGRQAWLDAAAAAGPRPPDPERAAAARRSAARARTGAPPP